MALLKEELENLTHKFLEKNGAEVLKRAIISRGDLKHVTVERQLEILDCFNSCRLGNFIINARGADGFWTDYMINYPNTGRSLGLNLDSQPLNEMEDFLLNRSPIVTSSQERFSIFQKVMQAEIKDGFTAASVPCGMMRDLISLDYSGKKNVRLLGVDIDAHSLELAKSLADMEEMRNIGLIQGDAWDLPFDNELDLLTSNGLNIYVDDKEKVIDLYRSFYKALKPGGKLVCGVLTYSPYSQRETDWNLDHFTADDLLMEKILHKDILDINWQNFRSIDELEDDFLAAGFKSVEVIMDKGRVFPTIVATK